MNRTKKLYEIREMRYNGSISRSVSPKLRDRKRATKLKNYLVKRFGMEVYTVGWNIAAH